MPNVVTKKTLTVTRAFNFTEYLRIFVIVVYSILCGNIFLSIVHVSLQVGWPSCISFMQSKKNSTRDFIHGTILHCPHFSASWEASYTNTFLKCFFARTFLYESISFTKVWIESFFIKVCKWLALVLGIRNNGIPIHWKSFGINFKGLFYRNIKIYDGWTQFFQLFFNRARLHIYLIFLDILFNSGKMLFSAPVVFPRLG